MITVSTTTNGGTSYDTAGTITVFGPGFTFGDTMTATVDSTGTVTAWQTPNGATTATYLGSVQLPNAATWTAGGGRIGMQLPPGGMIDNFAGANF